MNWISSKEKLPENDGYYWVKIKYPGFKASGFFNGGKPEEYVELAIFKSIQGCLLDENDDQMIFQRYRAFYSTEFSYELKHVDSWMDLEKPEL